MPSHTPKQAKVMSAISHGWKPSHGSVAKIPLKVAKEFHAADAGHKYGKGMHHKFGGGKVQALHIVRKYKRKAEGGEVDDTPPVDQPRLDVYRGMPPVSPNLGLSQDLMKKTPLEGMDPVSPSVTQHHDTPRDIIANALRGPDTKSYEPRAVLANKAMNVLDMTPPMQAEQVGESIAKGNMQEAAMGVLPPSKKALDLSKALEYASKYALSGIDHPVIQQAEKATFKQLKANYPKDIASQVIEGDYTPEQIDNVKTHMTPGAQAAFDKHYKKMAKKKEPSFEPSLWNTPDIQATKPKPTDADYIEKFHTSQGTNYSKLLADTEKALGLEPEPYTPHNPNEFNKESFREYLDADTSGFKPKGDDSDIEDYYKHLEEHEAGPEWKPDPSEVEGPREPTNELHHALSPHDLEEKSAKLGLNTTAFHGTKKNFSEFKLPEEMDRSPEVGVHFGTLKAAIDRSAGALHPLKRKAIEESLKNNEGISQINGLYLRPPAPEGSQFNVIPARIGANNPLVLRDLGTWHPAQMSSALHDHPEFTVDEVQNAMKSRIKNNSFSDIQRAETERIQNIRKLIESKGYDSIAYRNNVEDPGSLSYIIWNLNKARSFYAKFDPAKAHSRNLGAAIAGLSMVPLGLYGAGEPEQKAEGGGVGDDFNTPLPPEDEAKFQVWKQQNMPGDSGFDYDQRGAYQAQFQQQPNGHWQDQFKKPNHPTFSDQSQYAVGDQRDRSGYWVGDQFIPPANKKRGGTVAKKNKDPEDHEFINFSKGGLIDSSVPGRTDKVPMKVPPGSYVLPADIPSALGEGNTKAGSEVLSKMFTHSAYGLKPMTQKAQKFHFDGFKKLSRGGSPDVDTPTPPGEDEPMWGKGYTPPSGIKQVKNPTPRASGGETDHTPIIAAGGEWIIHPDVVKHVGEGNMSQGHRLLDKFVLHTRAEHIKTLKKLKGPKK